MDSNEILKIAEESRRYNRDLLNHLGLEGEIRLTKNPDEEIIEKLKELVPKSPEGKIAALAVGLFLGYLIFKK